MQNEMNKDRLLTRGEVQSHFGLSQRFLETSVTRGGGPPVVRLGRSVRYRVRDVLRWIDDNTFEGPDQ
jgi:predicted DNA-binding transcriptional regulator AlpA